MVDEIAAELKNTLQREITSEKIGELVLQRLKDIDAVAYIRFASVYKDFNDVDSFMRIISEFKENGWLIIIYDPASGRGHFLWINVNVNV